MGGTVRQFLLIVSASVVATLLAAYLQNNVRAVRRITGGL